MDNKKLYLTVGWLAIAGAILLIAAIVFSKSILIKILIITGILLIVTATLLPNIFEGEE